MAYVIDYELLEKLEQKVGKEEAKKIAQTIELIYNELDKKSEVLAQCFVPAGTSKISPALR